MPPENNDRTLAAIGAMFLDLYSRQIALMGLLRSQPGFDEATVRNAVRKTQEQLSKIPTLATLRSQPSGQRLEEIEEILRTTMLPIA
jgi:hypothetical protein